MPYPEMNRWLDAAYPAGALNYWKSSFLADLSDDAIEVLVEHFAAAPSPMMQLAIESFHGAVARLGVTETAVPHRGQGFNVLIMSVWTDPAASEEKVEWTRDVYDRVAPVSGRPAVRELPRRRRQQRGAGGVWRELCAACRGEAAVRP
jgi:hypothetical protein